MLIFFFFFFFREGGYHYKRVHTAYSVNGINIQYTSKNEYFYSEKTKLTWINVKKWGGGGRGDKHYHRDFNNNALECII